MGRTKVDIISGFLGAGKTTFIKRLLEGRPDNEKTVLIENEFGEVGIDGGFLKDSGIDIREMNSGCICCSLVGDFSKNLKEILDKYRPDRVIIEPSGVGKLSDVLKAVADAAEESGLENNSAVTIVDAKKVRLYAKNFGEFFNNQIENAKVVVLSRTDIMDREKIDESVKEVRKINPDVKIIDTPVNELSSKKLFEILETDGNFEKELLREVQLKSSHSHEEHEHHSHEHEHHSHGEHEHHSHEYEHHSHGEHEHHSHEHEHHSHGEHEHHSHEHEHYSHEEHEHHSHEHEHHSHEEHEHSESCTCGCHDHHHHHHADEVFDSWGSEQMPPLEEGKLREILEELAEGSDYGIVLRAKGMLRDKNSDKWIYFDLVPGEVVIRNGEPDYTGKVCVIGTKLNTEKLEKAFES